MDKDSSRFVIGKKQILREMKGGNVAEIVIAADADREYTAVLTEAARLFNVPFVIGSSMEELSDCFDVDVPCGAVGKLKI